LFEADLLTCEIPYLISNCQFPIADLLIKLRCTKQLRKSDAIGNRQLKIGNISLRRRMAVGAQNAPDRFIR
jgi:hypothetical protein